MNLAGRTCVVTGASSGVGKGIAVALGAAGATVVLTARNEAGLQATSDAVEARGGQALVFPCDLADDASISDWARRIDRLLPCVDALVNCASCIPDALIAPGPFWDKPLHMADQISVGLRSTYVATHALAPALLGSQSGSLVVNISSPGARAYMHGPAYGATKAGLDKLTHDMAHDFRPYGVAVVGLWPGVVATEKTQAAAQAEPDKYGPLLMMAESVEFNGRIIGALLTAADRMERSGKIFYSAELAQAFGITDEGGKQPVSHRDWFGETSAFSTAVV